jgi:hypothetical protein
MRPRSSTWEWGAFADAMRCAKGQCDSWAAKRLFAATRVSFARWLCRDRVQKVERLRNARRLVRIDVEIHKQGLELSGAEMTDPGPSISGPRPLRPSKISGAASRMKSEAHRNH